MDRPIGVEDPARYVEVEERARELLVRFQAAALTGSLPELLRAEFMPRPGDAAKAFLPQVAPALEAAYAQLWANPPDGGPRPDQRTLMVTSASARDFQLGTRRAGQFPGGYGQVTPYLQPDRLWIRWKFVVGTASAGMAYDGLVWLDDHFAWFPKPWRALAAASAPRDLDN